MKPIKIAVMAIIAASALVMFAASSNSTEDDTVAVQLDENRYQIEKTGDKFVRMDRKTGAVSVCALEGDNLICRLGADERAAYEESLDDMNTRLKELEARLARLEAGGAKLPVPKVPLNKDKPQEQGEEPDLLAKDLDRAMEFAREAMSRFMDVIQDLKEEYSKQEQPKT